MCLCVGARLSNLSNRVSKTKMTVLLNIFFKIEVAWRAEKGLV